MHSGTRGELSIDAVLCKMQPILLEWAGLHRGALVVTQIAVEDGVAVRWSVSPEPTEKACGMPPGIVADELQRLRKELLPLTRPGQYVDAKVLFDLSAERNCWKVLPTHKFRLDIRRNT